MMDIYRYLKSPDIRRHCQEMNKPFNMLEAAAIVSRSDCPWGEKIEGWRDILGACDDMPVEGALYPDGLATQSVAVQVEVQIQKHLEAIEDWHDETDALFCFGKTSFRSLNEALAFVSHDGAEKNTITIEKHCAGKMSCSAWYSADGKLHSLRDDRKEIWGAVDKLYFTRFRIYVPTPFKAGDILTFVPSFFLAEWLVNPFLLEKMPYSNEMEFLELLRQGEEADTDWHFLRMTQTGNVCRETSKNYLSLCYFQGELEEHCKALAPMRHFYSGEITLGELMHEQNTALLQELSKRNSLFDFFI